MIINLSQEIWNNITQYLSSLNPVVLALLFGFGLDPVQQKRARVWRTIFQSEEWLVAAERQGLNPVLVEYDLEYCYDISRTTKDNERFLVLRFDDTSGDFTLYNQEMSDLFFFCLQPYEFDKARAEKM